MEIENIIPKMIALARDAQIKQTEEILLIVEQMTETPEIKDLKERLHIADEKINKQCDFALRVNRLVNKYA